MKQFFYTRKVTTQREADEQPIIKEYRDSFNVDMVIRSVQMENGETIVLLKDFHERVTSEPEIDLKTNKMKGYKNVRQTVQSEITLSTEDTERFYKLTNIEN